MRKYLEIGKRLKILRGNRTQQDFSKEIKTTVRAYQHYEAGERVPHVHLLSRIAEMCDTTVDWILTGELNIEKARRIEWLKRASTIEELVERLEESVRREEKLLAKAVKEMAPEYGLGRLGQMEDKDLVERMRSYLTDVKVDLLSPEDRRVVDDLLEILKSGNADIIDVIKANIKAFRGATTAIKEKRRYPRFLLNLPIDVQITDGLEIHSGVALNASQMGLLIQSDHDLPIGKTIDLKVAFQQDAVLESFRAKAQIMWKDKPLSGGAERFRYGVKLTEVLDEGHAKLESILLE